MRRPMKKQAASLTAREREILELIWNGLKNREMGKQLRIRVKTVGPHNPWLSSC